MIPEVETYLKNLTKLLNGQLRGAINLKARKDNEELIRMTLNDAFEKGEEYGTAITIEKYAIDNLKNQLNDGEEPIRPTGPENQID